MRERWGYRLLRGRNGAAGHVKEAGDRVQVMLRGLKTENECMLCGRTGSAVRLVSRLKPEKGGTAQYSGPWEEGFFAVQGGRVLLWEDGGRGEESYLFACRMLKDLEKEQREENRASFFGSFPEEKPTSAGKREAKEQHGENAFPMEERKSRETELPFMTQEPLAPRQAAWETPSMKTADDPIAAAAAEKAEKEKGTDQPRREAAYTLRPRGSGAPVDGLPALSWIGEAEKWRPYFDRLPPFSPFDWPGWRFVKIPARRAGQPYMALGVEQKENQTAALAFALPGPPYGPYAALPGYRYIKGKDGQGYWVIIRQMGGEGLASPEK